MWPSGGGEIIIVRELSQLQRPQLKETTETPGSFRAVLTAAMRSSVLPVAASTSTILAAVRHGVCPFDVEGDFVGPAGILLEVHGRAAGLANLRKAWRILQAELGIEYFQIVRGAWIVGGIDDSNGLADAVGGSGAEANFIEAVKAGDLRRGDSRDDAGVPAIGKHHIIRLDDRA